MKKIYLLLPLVLILVGCVGQSTDQQAGEQPAASNIQPQSAQESEPQANGQVAETPTETVVEFNMTAKQWEFEPAVIEVNQGDRVKLSIKSIDVTHGIALPDFNISERLEAGKTVELEFVADKAGSFSFFCNVLCGSGHRGMTGTIIVK